MSVVEELAVDRDNSRLFYIGTADQAWLRRTEAPWCISRNHLGLIPPRARGPYILDSGAFTELDRYGGWTITPAEYVKQLDFWYFRPGPPDYIGPLDWPCEEQMLAKTKKTVYEHQQLTVASFLETTDRCRQLQLVIRREVRRPTARMRDPQALRELHRLRPGLVRQADERISRPWARPGVHPFVSRLLDHTG